MITAASRTLTGPDAPDDEELVARTREGDEDAVRSLVRRYNRQLFRVARGVVRDDAEAEDIVQETYVRAFMKLDSFRGEASLSTWLTRIALNEALGRVQRRKRAAELSSSRDGGCFEGRLIMFPASSPSPESEAAREQVRRVLEQAVDGLPDAFRMVFILRDIEGFSTEEAAEQLSIRPETIKTRLHRARGLMRNAVAKALSPTLSELFPFDGERCAGMADRVVERLRKPL